MTTGTIESSYLLGSQDAADIDVFVSSLASNLVTILGVPANTKVDPIFEFQLDADDVAQPYKLTLSDPITNNPILALDADVFSSTSNEDINLRIEEDYYPDAGGTLGNSFVIDRYDSGTSAMVPMFAISETEVWHETLGRFAIGGGGAGEVDSVTGGSGITASPTTANVIVSITSGGVTNTHLANDAVTEDIILNASVTHDKIGSRAVGFGNISSDVSGTPASVKQVLIADGFGAAAWGDQTASGGSGFVETIAAAATSPTTNPIVIGGTAAHVQLSVPAESIEAGHLDSPSSYNSYMRGNPDGCWWDSSGARYGYFSGAFFFGSPSPGTWELAGMQTLTWHNMSGITYRFHDNVSGVTGNDTIYIGSGAPESQGMYQIMINAYMNDFGYLTNASYDNIPVAFNLSASVTSSGISWPGVSLSAFGPTKAQSSGFVAYKHLTASASGFFEVNGGEVGIIFEARKMIATDAKLCYQVSINKIV